MQRLSELAISKNPEPESFAPHADGKFSFAFLPYDSHAVCRIDCIASNAEEARAQALNWLKLSYWNDDGTSVIPEPIFWSTLVKPDGTKLGKIV